MIPQNRKCRFSSVRLFFDKESPPVFPGGLRSLRPIKEIKEKSLTYTISCSKIIYCIIMETCA